jgi:hypothetical protein
LVSAKASEAVLPKKITQLIDLTRADQVEAVEAVFGLGGYQGI